MSYHDPQFIKTIDGPKSNRLREHRVVRNYMPLVRKLAWQIYFRISKATEIEDLVQIGSLALVEACRTFEDRGLGFGSYAKLRVRGAMIDELRKQSDLSRSALEFRREMQAAESRLSQRLGGAVDEFSLARELGMNPQDFRMAFDNAQTIEWKSIEDAYSEYDICFEADEERVDKILMQQEQYQLIELAILRLTEREAMILQLYFEEEMKLGEIGKALGIGAARVCQLKKAALEKLKPILADLK